MHGILKRILFLQKNIIIIVTKNAKKRLKHIEKINNNDQWFTVSRGVPLRSPVCRDEKSFAQLEFSYYLIFSYSVIASVPKAKQ